MPITAMVQLSILALSKPQRENEKNHGESNSYLGVTKALAPAAKVIVIMADFMLMENVSEDMK